MLTSYENISNIWAIYGHLYRGMTLQYLGYIWASLQRHDTDEREREIDKEEKWRQREREKRNGQRESERDKDD